MVVFSKLCFVFEGGVTMKPRIATLLVMVSVVMFSMARVATAGPLEDADAFFKRKDFVTAEKLYRRLAEQGNADAQWVLGRNYQYGAGVDQDSKEALKWYRLAAEQGNANAQLNLALMFHDGLGVPGDIKEAVIWYRLSAQQGNPDAQLHLGVLYRDGRGIPQDYKEAVKWYRLSAEQGNTIAQWSLGLMFQKGMGVPQDLVRSHMWYNLSSIIDSYHAKDRDEVAKIMTSSQIAQAQAMATKCYALNFKSCD